MKNGNKHPHLNRTGAALSPDLTSALIEGTQRWQPSSPRRGDPLAEVRISYAEEAEPVGSIPPPVDAKGMIKNPPSDGRKKAACFGTGGERLPTNVPATHLRCRVKFDRHGTWPEGPRGRIWKRSAKKSTSCSDVARGGRAAVGRPHRCHPIGKSTRGLQGAVAVMADRAPTCRRAGGVPGGGAGGNDAGNLSDWRARWGTTNGRRFDQRWRRASTCAGSALMGQAIRRGDRRAGDRSSRATSSARWFSISRSARQHRRMRRRGP